jgi:hypothetical protein
MHKQACVLMHAGLMLRQLTGMHACTFFVQACMVVGLGAGGWSCPA